MYCALTLAAQENKMSATTWIERNETCTWTAGDDETYAELIIGDWYESEHDDSIQTLADAKTEAARVVEERNDALDSRLVVDVDSTGLTVTVDHASEAIAGAVDDDDICAAVAEAVDAWNYANPGAQLTTFIEHAQNRGEYPVPPNFERKNGYRVGSIEFRVIDDATGEEI
jgi:hypothetical protein